MRIKENPLMGLLLLSIFAYGEKWIDIDLSQQKLYLKDGNRTILSTRVSTGNIHHPTPAGTFRIFQKERHHKSTLYPVYADGKRGGAKMDYMLKFAPAVAIHEGEVIYEEGRSIPVSHGCVRVPPGKAKAIFNMAKRGTRVVVRGRAPYENTFNRYLADNTNHSDEMIYYDNDIYDGESALNIAISTADLEEI